jgi:hypothetical protein
MKNNTKTKITITMNHVDNSHRLYKFLKDALERAGQGGDFDMSYSDKEKRFIGHDVEADITHKICDKWV